MYANSKTTTKTKTTKTNANTTANNTSVKNVEIDDSGNRNNSNNNKTATLNTSATHKSSNSTKPAETDNTTSTASSVGPQLSLFDQLKNSANLNNIKCGNNNNNNNNNESENDSIYKTKTPKNLTEWRKFAEDDSSNNSASSSSSGGSSSSSSSSINNGICNAHILSEKDSFQQKFIAAVLGKSNASSCQLKATKKDATQAAAKISHATVNSSNNNKNSNSSNSAQSSLSKMNSKNIDAKLPATEKQIAEPCGNILDLTLQPAAKRNMNSKAPGMVTPQKGHHESKVNSTTTAICKSSELKINSNTSTESVCDKAADSKLTNATTNAHNNSNEVASGNKGTNVNKPVNSNAGDNSNSNTNYVSTTSVGVSQQQQQQQQPEQQRPQIKFPVPTLPPPSSPSATKAAADKKSFNCINNSVGIVRGTKRFATATATSAESVEPSTVSSSNNFPTPASTAHYFAQSKRQKQTAAVAAATNSSAHFAGILSDQQQKQYMDNLRALLDTEKLNSVYARHHQPQSASDLKAVVYSALTSALCGGNSATATAASKLLAAANQAKKKRKKKRCTDRCDSSESSDR